MSKAKCVQVLLHPRTSAFVEITYAGHGILATSDFTAILVFLGVLVVAIAHFVWAAGEVA